MSNTITAELERKSAEAGAFDAQILQRVRHGHLPDLRRAMPCDYFYNNSWRHPEYVRLDFGEIFELIHAAIVQHARASRTPRVLEIGCGPGHICLELARNGCDVTGIDLSSACIKVAKDVADQDPWKANRGPLQYLTGDIYDPALIPNATFDAVVFVGALHHFADQSTILTRVSSLLKPGGLVIAHEPTRDRITQGNTTFALLLRVLLSASGGHYERLPIPERPEDIQSAVCKLMDELTCRTADGGKAQSPCDNDAGFAQMLPALREQFQELIFKDRYAFFHELIGGLRFEEKTNIALARSLRAFDAELCRAGVLQPTEFFFVGRRRA